MTRILAALAAVLLTCAPAAAQLDTRTIPQAQPLTGTERMPAVQGSGCTAKTTPCASVAVTPALISTFLTPVFQPLDTDLTAIAALTTTSTGRDLLTSASAAAIRNKAGAAASGANSDITALSGLTTALSVAQGGTGRTSAIPVLSASRSGSSSFQTISNGFTTVQVNAATIDTAACFSTTSYICTLPETGLYQLSAKLRICDAATAGISYGIGIGTTNADSAAFFWGVTAGSRMGLANARVYAGTAGDQVRLFAYADQALPVCAAELNIYRIR
ncbi:hypothetical protein [uncultured Sphingomonas sp.]|uniref:hypothetical protein n=1 Tax=uncultured Sphingomonas sp. TaxID=158754 RepID=UPI002610CB01|nr:hypothetical protein [uncultured Sphingomonas sp.]